MSEAGISWISWNSRTMFPRHVKLSAVIEKGGNWDELGHLGTTLVLSFMQVDLVDNCRNQVTFGISVSNARSRGVHPQ